MKNLDNYITEKLRINKNTNIYKYFPETKDELRKILEERLAEDKNADLNDIDVSKITDMGVNDDGYSLFENLDPHNIDISEWDVSNVENMSYLFFECINFNSDLSKWNVSNVKYMNGMFYWCKKFNCDLSKWDVSNVGNMECIFANCNSLKNKPNWYKE